MPLRSRGANDVGTSCERHRARATQRRPGKTPVPGLYPRTLLDRPRAAIIFLAIVAAVSGCTADRQPPATLDLAPAPTVFFRPSAPPRPVSSFAGVQPIATSPPLEQKAIRLVSGSEDVPRPAALPNQTIHCELKANPIDLATALRLADGENLQVAYAREQLRQALSRAERADVLWLPSIRGGVGFNQHDGAIQNVNGAQIDANRGALYFGAGGSAYGNGSPTVPGVYANFSLADALFQPLAAQQLVGARQNAASAVQNDTLLRVALAYLELLRANQELTIAGESRDLTRQLAELTGKYAKTGEGLQSDADRMQAELAVRLNDVQRADEGVELASARLAQLLRLDPATPLNPVEPTVVPIDMAPADATLRELIAQGLSQRPELAEARLLVGEAAARLRREQLAPLLPNVIVGVSEGDMTAGQSGSYAPAQNRFDLDAIAYWELRNFGFGDRAAQNEVRSQMQQAQIRQSDIADPVAREVVEAAAQVRARHEEIATARQGIRAATESQSHNLQRIQAGKGLPIEALLSVQALAQGRREYLRTVIDYDDAQFSLYRAIGSPVMHYADNVAPPWPVPCPNAHPCD